MAPRADRQTQPLSILVVRSGGFAGISQRWLVDAAASTDADEWRGYVDACPWGASSVDVTSRDRFVWRIEVRAGRRKRVASVPDRDLTGPWRELVDRVQEHGTHAHG